MLILHHSHVTAVFVNNDVQRRRQNIDQKFASVEGGYNASRLLAEFPDKGWTKRSINRLFQNLRDTGTVDRCQPAKTASHRHLVKSVSGRHRRRNRPMASATTSVCEGKGTSFRVPGVANRPLSEPPLKSNLLFSQPPKAFRRRHSAFAYT